MRADAALLAGISVPAGPHRSLRRLPGEVWLDAAGLARRISVNSEPAAAADARVWSIVGLWDFASPSTSRLKPMTCGYPPCSAWISKAAAHGHEASSPSPTLAYVHAR